MLHLVMGDSAMSPMSDLERFREDIKELRVEVADMKEGQAEFKTTIAERLAQVAGELRALATGMNHQSRVFSQLQDALNRHAAAIEDLDKKEIRRDAVTSERDSRIQAQIEEHEQAISELKTRQVASQAIAREKRDERNYQRWKIIAMLAGAAATGRFGPEVLGALFKALSH